VLYKGTFLCRLVWTERSMYKVGMHIGTSCHTHTPFNGPFSRTTRVSRYQKGKTNLDFTEARGSEWQWHQLGRVQVCISLQTHNHASTPPLVFLRARCPFCRQQLQSTEGNKTGEVRCLLSNAMKWSMHDAVTLSDWHMLVFYRLALQVM